MKRFAIFILCNLLTFLLTQALYHTQAYAKGLHATRKALCCCWTVWRKEAPCPNTALITSVRWLTVHSPDITCPCIMPLMR